MGAITGAAARGISAGAGTGRGETTSATGAGAATAAGLAGATTGAISGVGADSGRARLVGLGRVDGVEVATVHADLTEALDEVATFVGSEVALTGSLRSTTTTTYDLADGTVRRATSRTSGTVDALVQPPRGVAALPVPAVITVDLRVRATRLP